MQSKLKFIALGLILVLGFLLRWKNYATVPVVGSSLDEYSFSWVGMSLIQLGMPVGAIGVGGYENNVYKYNNVDRIFQTGVYASPININWPWFDHPPLLGLFAGSFATITGARVFEDATLLVIRKPMVILGTITLLLVMILAYQYFGFMIAAVSGLIYATSPLVVVSSRMVQAENLLIVWFLLILIMLKKEKWLWVGIFTSLAFWTKFSAVAIVPVILYQIANSKKQNEIFKTLIYGFLPGIIMLLSYYWIYGWETFWAVTKANSNREYAIGINAFWDLITKTRITHLKLFPDGWVLASWIAFLAYRKFNLLKVFVVSYLATYLLFGNFPHGWYSLPFWPILYIFLGKLIADGHGLLLTLLPLGLGINKTPEVNMWRWGIYGVLISSLLIKNIKIIKIINVIILALAIVTNAYWVYKLTPDLWYKI